MKRILRLISAVTVALGAVLSASAQPPVAQPVPARHRADQRFAQVEHDYMTYVLAQFPVVATYLGGSAFDPSLADVDGTLRDYSPAALQNEDARLAEFRDALLGARAGQPRARRRIDRSVALAQIAFLMHEHQVRRYQRALARFLRR